MFAKLSQNIPDVTADYGKSFEFIAFLGYFHTFMFELLYLHRTFNKLCVQLKYIFFKVQQNNQKQRPC